MNSKNSLKKTGRFLARPSVWIPLVILLLVILATLLLPYGIKRELERWLIEEGAEQARIEDVDFNPFIGHIAVRNIQVTVGSSRTLLVSQGNMEFALFPLLRKQLVIKEIHLRDSSVLVERTSDDQWRFAGLKGSPKKPNENTKNSSDWSVSLRRVVINHSEVRYKAELHSVTARIDHCDIKINTRAGTDGVPIIDAIQGKIAGNLQGQLKSPGVTGAAKIDVSLTFSPRSGDPATWRVTGAGGIDDIDILWPDSALRVAAAKKIDIEGISISGDGLMEIRTLSVNDLAIAQSTASAEAPTSLRAAHLHLGEIRFDPKQALSIAEVKTRGLHIVARHEAKGGYYGFDKLGELRRKFTSPDQSGDTLRVRAGTITIDPPGVIELSDLAVTPAFQTSMNIMQAKMTGLDTGLTPLKPAVFSMSAGIGKYATVKLNGEIQAFTPKMVARLKGEIREFDLPPLSPYATRMLGYRIESGQLKSDLDINIDNGKLDGKNKLAFANLSMSPKDEASAEQLKTRLAVPFESALTMLRDKNNNVHLDTNISGNTNDPKFDLTDAINQALTKALRGASVSYLKLYFQPFGTLITVAELAGKAMQLKLDPVPFSAGTASPTTEAQEYLMKVGKLLQERGNLRIKLCGKAVPKDGLEGEAARALAARRAETTKDYFVGSFSIATDRLFLCDPVVDIDAEAKPRLELAI